VSDTVNSATYVRALRWLCIALLFIAALGSTTPAHAAVISDFQLVHEQWYVFQEADAFITRCGGLFGNPDDPNPCDSSDQPGEQDLPALDDQLISEGASIFSSGNLVFAAETPMWLRIIDAGLAGVSYRPTFLGGFVSEEIDYFASVGYSTLDSLPARLILERPAGDVGAICTNVAACWADPSFYVAELYLDPGSYAVRLQLDLENPGPNDFAYVGVFADSVLAPEPGTWVLMGLGLAAVALGRRKRSA
jgi:hypothetical protein